MYLADIDSSGKVRDVHKIKNIYEIAQADYEKFAIISNDKIEGIDLEFKKNCEAKQCKNCIPNRYVYIIERELEDIMKFVNNSTEDEWMTFMVSLSSKIIKNVSKGIQDRGNISIKTAKKNRSLVFIKGTSHTEEDVEVVFKGYEDESYKATVQDILKTVGSEKAYFFVPLKWRYIDTDNMYNNLMSQVAQKYIFELIPSSSYSFINMDDETGLLPEDNFTNIRGKSVADKMKNGTILLNKFFYNFLRYRVTIRGQEARNRYGNLELVASLQPIIHPVTFFSARRFPEFTECKHGWNIESISSGKNMYEACCSDRYFENDYCSHIAKVSKFNNEKDRYIASRELEIWMRVESLGLSPKLVELYDNETYDIFIIKKSDMTLYEAEKIAYKEDRDDILLRLFFMAGGILNALHYNYIAHCNSDFKNFILTSSDKSIFTSPNKLFRALESGDCGMIITNFESSTTLERLQKNTKEELENLYPILPRLFSLGCLSSKEKEEFYGIDMEILFRILCFYDYSPMIPYIKKYGDDIRFKSMIYGFQQSVSKGTQCEIGKEIVNVE